MEKIKLILTMNPNAGPVIVLSYAISGFSTILSVFSYAEFVVDIPTVGGLFSFLRIELGEFFAYIAAGNVLLEAIVGVAGLGHSWSSDFASLISSNPDMLRIRLILLLKDSFIRPSCSCSLVDINGIAISRSRRTSILTWVTSLLSVGIIIFIIISLMLMPQF